MQIASNAVFDLVGLNQTVASLSDIGGSGGTVTNRPRRGNAVLAPPSGSTTFSGVIQDGNGPLSLALTGSGTQGVTGNNTYSGGTVVNSGTSPSSRQPRGSAGSEPAR